MAVAVQLQQFTNTYPKIATSSIPSQYPNDVHETSLLDLLERAARRYPRNGISYHTSNGSFEAHDSYVDILALARENATNLTRGKIIRKQKPVLLAFENYRDSLTWYWSVLAAGGIPALLPPRRGTKESWIKELQHISSLLQFPATLSDRSNLDDLLDAGGVALTCVDDIVGDKEHQSPYQQNYVYPSFHKLDQICTILFTSGSTGPSKAVCYSHRQLLVASHLKRQANNICHTDQFLCWISFDHSVALCELHLHALDAGASLLVVPGCVFTQDPMLFWRVLSEHKIAYTFAPNSFLAAATRAYEDSKKRASNHSDLAFSFRRLKVLFCGGEANKTSTLAAAAELLSSFGAPANAVTAVYGLSETCSALFYNRAGPSYDVGQKNAFASVGVPLPGHHLRIVDNFNQSIQSTNTQGSVQLRGSTIFQAYFNNVNATDAAITEDGWFDTGDLGSLDKLGNLRIAGRTKDVFIINGQNFSCGDLEYAIENCNLDGIEPGYTVSFSIWPDDGDTEEVVILYNPIHDQFDISSHLERTIKGIAGEVVQFCKKRPYMVIPLPRSYLPRSSIGKLSRAKLRSLFLAGEFRQFEHHQKATNSDSSCLEPRQAAIASVFSQYLGIPYASLSPDTLIESLGIDSLSYLKLLSGLERTFSLVRALSMNDLMACSTIRKMDAMIVHATEETRTTTYRPVEVLRATGSKTPLILCHTGNGGFLNYLALWPMIPDRKILALHAPSAETQHGAFPSLTQMLDTYVEAIKSHQPLGPYAFLGFCFGGVLAFELTKRFEALGDEVVFCGGLDSPPDVSIMKDTRFSDDIIDERHHLMSILISVDMVDRNDVPMLLEKLSAVPNKDVLKQTVSMLTQAALDRAGLSESKLQSWVTMSADIYRIAVDYLPSGSVRSFDAFYATSPPIGTDIPDAARWRSIYIAEWKSYVLNATNRDICFDYAERSPRERAGRPLRLHCIEGTHETMTTPENVCALGRRINDMILLREREWDIPSEK